MKKIFYSAALLCMMTGLTNAQMNWTHSNGPYGGFVNKIYVIPGTENIFCGTNSAGIFRSTNNGQNWSEKNNGINGYWINCFTSYSNKIFAATTDEVFRSENNGETWTNVNAGLGSNSTTALLADGANVFAGTDGGVFLTTDNGTNWIQKNSGLSNTYVSSLAINGANLYAGTFGGVFVSSNNGNSWNKISVGLTDSIIYSLATSGSLLLAGTYTGVFLSTNNGTSWNRVSTTDAVYSVVFKGTYIFSGGLGFIYRSTDTCSSWTLMDTGLTHPFVYSLTVKGSDIFTGTSGGVFLSTNNGTNWSPVNNGLVNHRIKSSAAIESNIYAGTESRGIFKSTNYGSSWIQSSINYENVHSMAVSGNNVFAGCEGNLIYSTDYGSTWLSTNVIPMGNSARALAVSESNIFAGTYGNGIYYSSDYGNSWTTRNDGLGSISIKSIALKDSVLYTCKEYSSGIYYSNNFGSSWSDITNGITQYIESIVFLDTLPFFGSWGGGVYTTTNRGASWIQVNSGLTNLNLRSLAVKGSSIFAGTLGGVFVSGDKGASWTLVNDGLGNKEVNSFTFSDSVIFAGTAGSSVFKSVMSPPSAPTGLTATAASSSQINLSWTASATGNPSKYYIYRSLTSGSGFTLVDSVTAPTTNKAHTVPNPSTTYYFHIKASNAFGLSSASNEASASSYALEPQNQPTSLTFPAFSTDSLRLSFTAATGSPAPTGYIILRRKGSAVTNIPQDGTAYTVGSVIGTATVAYTGPATAFNDKNLDSGAVYHYSIFSYRGGLDSINYKNSSPLSGSRSTLTAQPTAQPTNIAFSNVQADSMRVSFTAASPAPTGYIVLRRAAAAPDSAPRDGNFYSIGNSIGAATVAYVGPATAFPNTGLTANTFYHYSIFSYNGSGQSANYLTSSPLLGNRSTLQTQPTAQPTNIAFSNVQADSMRVSFTAASPAPTGYIVLRRASAAPDSAPRDGNFYGIGNSIGLATVAYVGSATTFLNTGLSPATNYYYNIYSYNGNGNTTNYLTNVPLSGSRSTLALEPAAQPTNIAFSNIQADSMRVSYTAASGVSGYIAVRSTGDSVKSIPIDGKMYAVNDTIGTDTVVYAGNGTSFANTGLKPNVIYHFKIYSYKGGSDSTNYLTSAYPLTGSQSTSNAQPSNQPTGLAITNPALSSLTLTYTASAGGAAGYLILKKASSSPAGIPVDGKTYAAGDTVGSDTVAYSGSNLTVNLTGLKSSTKYYFDIFAYNGTGQETNYLTTTPLEGNRSTLALEPQNQPTSLTFPAFSTDSLRLSFTAATGNPAPTGYIILRRKGSVVTNIPQDGTAYTVGSVLGTATVAYTGDATAFNDKNLDSGAVYHYSIFSYRGGSDSINYKNTSPLMGSRSTLAVEPAGQPENIAYINVQPDSMRVSFTAATGSPSGYIVLRRALSAPDSAPRDGNSYSIGNSIGAATVAYVGPATAFPNTGLTANTFYHYSIFSYNGSGQSANYLTSSPLLGNRSTLQTQPTAQPTNIAFSNVQADSMRVSFTAASPAPTGYIILRRASAAPDSAPRDGNFYSIGNSIGAATVAYAGAATTFLNTGLSPATNYYYNIYSYNGNGNTTNYLTNVPLSGNRSTLALEPAGQPSNLSFTFVVSDSVGLSFLPAGGASGYITLRSANQPVTDTLQDGITYTQGTTVGSSIVAHIGADTSFSITGLSSATRYYFAVFSYRGGSDSANYLAASPLRGDTVTSGVGSPPSAPTGLTATAISSCQINLSWTASASGEPEIYRIFRFNGSDFSQYDSVQAPNISYIDSNSLQINPSTTYHYRVYALNAFGMSGPSDIDSATTFAVEPTAQPENIAFSNIQSDSLRVSFTAASGVTGYIAVRSTGDSVISIPIDGKMYSVNDTIGTDTVVYAGNGTSFANTGLMPDVIYHFKIYSYRGGSDTTNYLTSVYPLTGSRSTLALEPAFQPTNMIFSDLGVTSYTVSFNQADGNPEGYIVIHRKTQPSVTEPADGTPYTKGDAFPDGMVMYVGSDTTFLQTGLSTTEEHFYKIFAYNGSGQSINYFTVNPLLGSRWTLAEPPSYAPTELVFSNIDSGSIQVNFTAVSGTDYYLAIRRSWIPPDSFPNNGIAYSRGNTIGSGVVAYAGSGTAFNDTGLNSNTKYCYHIFSFNGSGQRCHYYTFQYLSGDTTTANTATPPAPPAGLTATAVSSGRIDLAWTGSATGNPTKYLIYRKDGPAYVLHDSVTALQWSYVDSIKGVDPSTTYLYRVYAVNAIGMSGPSNIDSATTFAVEPTAQPTNIAFSNVQADSMRVSFTAASPAPAGYIILRRATAAPDSAPRDGNFYSTGNSIGAATVAYVGPATTVLNTGLSPATNYYYNIYSYNGSGNTTNYLTNSPLSGSRSTLATEPSAQPTNFTFTNVGNNSISVSFTTASGTDGYIAVRREGTHATGDPVDGQGYNTGDGIGGGKVVFAGSDNSFDDTELNPSTRYYYKIYSYNGAGQSANYLIINPLARDTSTAGTVTVPTHQPTNLVFSDIDTITYRVTFNRASGYPSGYLVLRSEINYPDSSPTNGQSYSPGAQLGNARVASVGIDTAYTETGLEPNTIYYYRIYSFNGTGSQTKYLTTNPLAGAQTTLAYEPTDQPSNLRFTNIAAASFKIEFDDASPKPAGYIVLRKINSAPTGAPSDGTAYTAGNSIGNGTVIYSGTEHEFTETGAAEDSTYYYAVYSYNGSGLSANYLTSNKLSGSYTHIAPPVIVSASISFTPASPVEGDTIRITVTVNGSSPSVYLTYGKGSQTSAFTDTMMVKDGQGYYNAVIPAPQVTSAGVVFRIEARNTVDTVYYPSAGYASIPVRIRDIPAVISIGSYPNGVSCHYYNTISLPLNDSLNLENYIGSSQGGVLWRLVTHSLSGWVDHTVMRKNTAYFFYHRKDTTVNFYLPNASTNATGLFENYTLKPGWNLVPWPYAFKADITFRDQSRIGPVWQMIEANYDSTTAQFKPFGGYVIYNKSGADLLIQDALTWSYTTLEKPLFEKSAGSLPLWSIHFKLRGERSRDLYNIIGVTENARDEFDVYDDPEPISPGNMTHVYFTVQDHKLACDLRAPNAEGHAWDIVIERKKNESFADLEWTPDNLPVGITAKWFNYTLNAITDLSDSRKFRISGPDVHKGRIIAGTAAYVNNEIQEIRKALPEKFALYPNYPNPFNPNTTIRFDVAKTGNVKLQIYNVLGQLVTTLVNGTMETGKYDIQWNGKDIHGNSVSSGIYIYRIVTDGYVKARKMVLVR